MLVRPCPRAYIRPQLRFFWTYDAYGDCTVVSRCARLNRPKKNVAEFDWPVAACAEQVEGSHSSKGTDFVKDGSRAIQKEALNDIKSVRAQVLEYAETKALSDRRIDAIKDRVRSCNCNPLGTAIGEQAP